MSLDYVRQIVSGNKARYVDEEHGVDLDLVYGKFTSTELTPVTDRIIIMGWPATGWASAYRNRRRDVLHFINSRHGDNWWIWNLCPLYENAYSSKSMHNRVSRYPFPDHHPPPLPLLPLAVSEMRSWLCKDPTGKSVAIIHCKAGKGRSGTLLCSYLLSLDSLPPPPSGHTQPATTHAHDDGWVVIGRGDDIEQVHIDPSSRPPSPSVHHLSIPRSTNSSTTTISRPSPPPSIKISVSTYPPYTPIDVGDERNPGEAGQADRTDGKVDAVFKLHSSRRMKPSSTGRGVSIPSQRRWCRYVNLLFSNRAPASYTQDQSPRIKLLSVTIVMNPPKLWLKPMTALLGGAGKGWASVARYDDQYVDKLKVKLKANETEGGVGGNGEWDSNKMFRSCGKLVAQALPSDASSWLQTKDIHHLEPANGQPLMLDRNREFRIKLHDGSLPLGWAWLIPAFHLPETVGSSRVHTLLFPRSQIDFPLGPGSAIEQVLVRLGEVPNDEPGVPEPLMSEEEERREGLDDKGRGEGARAGGVVRSPVVVTGCACTRS